MPLGLSRLVSVAKKLIPTYSIALCGYLVGMHGATQHSKVLPRYTWKDGCYYSPPLNARH